MNFDNLFFFYSKFDLDPIFIYYSNNLINNNHFDLKIIVATGIMNSCIFYLVSIFPMQYVNAIIVGSVSNIF